MEQACSEMHARIASGDIHSLIVIVQAQGSAAPQTVIMGRYTGDLFRALAALERGRREVHRLLDRHQPGDLSLSAA